MTVLGKGTDPTGLTRAPARVYPARLPPSAREPGQRSRIVVATASTAIGDQLASTRASGRAGNDSAVVPPQRARG